MMFKRNKCKINQITKGGALRMRKNLICMLAALVVFAFCSTSAWAALSQTVTVDATVPVAAAGVTVTVSRVTGTTWTSASSISFGTLVWDTVNKIFLPASYFAIDVGVSDNVGGWTVTHTRTSLAGNGTNLNDKVNVSFVKQTSSTTSEPLQYLSYTASNNISYNNLQLAGGWLRIYYGIGTGDTTAGKEDASGVTPIGMDTPAGTYNGSVTITLTP